MNRKSIQKILEHRRTFPNACGVPHALILEILEALAERDATDDWREITFPRWNSEALELLQRGDIPRAEMILKAIDGDFPCVEKTFQYFHAKHVGDPKNLELRRAARAVFDSWQIENPECCVDEIENLRRVLESFES